MKEDSGAETNPSKNELSIASRNTDTDTSALEKILECTQTGYWDWDVANNKEYLSPSFKKMLGYADEELPNYSNAWKKIIFQEDLPALKEAFQKHVESKGSSPFSVRVRYLHKNGSTVWVLCRGEVIEWQDDNTPRRAVGCHIDITDKVNTENALRESEKRFRLTFENVGAGIAIVALDGTILQANDAFQRLLAYSEQELSKMTFAEFTHPDDITRDVNLYRELQTGKIPHYNMEKRYIRKDGQLIWANLSVSLARDEDTNQPLYAVSIVQDISIRKKAIEEQIKAGKQLENFAYVTSHDLQEPIRTIHSFTTLLKEKCSGDKLDAEAEQYLTFITDASSRMQELIKALLDYSRIGKNENKEEVDFNELVSTVIQDMNTLISETDTQIKVHNLPTLNVFSTEMRLLFQNLISNAIKFRKTDEKPQIEINVTVKNENWLFSVSDNGIGIEDKYHEKIFQVFQRLHTRSAYEGTGIGLAHCKKIVDIHRGEIWLESKPGEGSSFYFTIPNKP